MSYRWSNEIRLDKLKAFGQDNELTFESGIEKAIINIKNNDIEKVTYYFNNKKTIIKIKKSIQIPIELGGGIRSEDDAIYWLNNNIDYLIIGSLAIKNIDLVKKIAKKYQNKIYVSLDLLDNKIMIKGWLEDSKLNLFEVFKIYNESKIKGYVLTDISRDGMMNGINFDFIKENISMTSKPIIIAGGLSYYSDLRELNNINSKTHNNIEGVIMGKAFYSGAIKIKESIKILNSDNYA